MSISRNIVLTVTRQSVAVLLRLVFIVLVARTLGPAANGQYALAVLVPTLLASILNLGVPAANTYYIARGGLAFAKAIRLNLVLWLALVALGAVGAGVALGFSAQMLPSIPVRLLAIGGLLYPCILASTFSTGLLHAVQDFRAANLALLIAPSLSLLVLIGFRSASATIEVQHVLMIQVLAELTALGYFTVVLRGHVRDAPREAGQDTTLKQLLTFGGVIHVGNTLMLLTYRADLFLLNAFVGPSAAGVYIVAVRITEQIWIASQSITSVVLPSLSARRDTPFTSDDSAARWLRVALYAGVAGGGALIVVVRPVLGWLFGPAYAGAASIMVTLLPGVLLLNAARVACVAMTARGRPERNVVVAVVVFAANVGLNFMLIPRFGPQGAAVATSAGYCLGATLALWLLSRLTQTSIVQLISPTRGDIASVCAAYARLRGR